MSQLEFESQISHHCGQVLNFSEFHFPHENKVAKVFFLKRHKHNVMPITVHGFCPWKSGDIKLPLQPSFILFQDASALQVAWATHMASLDPREALPLL